MGFYGRLSYIVRNSFRMLEFYHFMKGLHEYIHCTNPITCRFYNFLCQSKIFCLKITKTLTRCRSSLPVTAAKDIRMIYFLQCLSGDFQKETVQQLKKIREHQGNEIRRQNYINFLSSVLATNYELTNLKVYFLYDFVCYQSDRIIFFLQKGFQ